MNNQVFKNWGMLIFSSFFSMGLSFITVIYLGNKLSIDEYGLFNTITAAVSLVSTFIINFACGTVLNRELAVNPHSGKSLIKKFVRLRLIAYIVAAIGLYIYQKHMIINDTIISVFVAVLLLTEISWELFEQIAFGYKVTKLTSVINTIGAVAWFIMVFLLPQKYATIQIVFSLYVIIMAIKSAVYAVLDYSNIIQSYELSEFSYFKVVKESSSYLWMRMLGTISTQFSVIILGSRAGLEEVAYYSVGSKFTKPITIILMTCVNAFFPYFTSFYKKSKDDYNRVASIGMSIVLIFGSFSALLLSATSHIWLVAVMGEKYSNAVDAFNYQIWFTVCLGFDTILSMILSTSFKQKLLAVITTIDTLLYIPMLYFTVSYGAKGLAIGKLISAAICVLYHMILIYIVLERKIKLQTMILAISYFVALFLIYMFVEGIIIQFIILLTLTLLTSIVPDSPVHQGIALFKEIYKSKGKEAVKFTDSM